MSHHPVETRGLPDGRTVHTQQHYPGEWTAHFDNYGGPESPMGYGSTEEEAIEDLTDKTEVGGDA